MDLDKEITIRNPKKVFSVGSRYTLAPKPFVKPCSRKAQGRLLMTPPGDDELPKAAELLAPRRRQGLALGFRVYLCLHCSSNLGLPFRILNIELVQPKKRNYDGD